MKEWGFYYAMNEVVNMSKEEAVLTLMDRTLKYFVTAGLIIVVGFGLLFLIAYVIDFVEKKVKIQRWILVCLLKKERENLAHNIMSVEINQDIIPKANNLHDKYLKDRKAVQETIDIFDSNVFACMEKLKNMQKQGTASKWLKGGK